MNSQPTNLTAIRRLANSWTKAQSLLKEGYQFIECTLPDSPVKLVAVRKPTDAQDAPSYWIHENFSAPEIKNGCSCPDFAKHNDYCKHTLAWEEIQKETAAIAQFEAAYKLIEEAECTAGVDYLL